MNSEIQAMLVTVKHDAKHALDVHLDQLHGFQANFEYVTRTYPNCPKSKAVLVARELAKGVQSDDKKPAS